ncbi:MAG TPA: riboflavin synthase [Pirellulales bacterium]
MFTGIVESLGAIEDLIVQPPGVRLRISAGAVTEGAAIGDSIAINGCCLTVVGIDGETLSFQAGEETLSRTNLGRLKAGSAVNLERSLKLGGRLGGHLVTGHIDGLGTLVERSDEGDWSLFWLRAPAELMRQIASKGSIAVDGVSLTVVDAEAERFSVALIPHTLQATSLGRLSVGDAVNLETDLIAKYVARLMQRDHA